MRQIAEDYLKYIYLLESKNGIVRGVDIAEMLGVSKPTVCVHVKHLLHDGFVNMNFNHEISLTEEGEKIALEVLEKNLTFRLLLEKLGVDSKIAERDACRMEHAVGRESFEALKKLCV